MCVCVCVYYQDSAHMLLAIRPVGENTETVYNIVNAKSLGET